MTSSISKELRNTVIMLVQEGGEEGDDKEATKGMHWHAEGCSHCCFCLGKVGK